MADKICCGINREQALTKRNVERFYTLNKLHLKIQVQVMSLEPHLVHRKEGTDLIDCDREIARMFVSFKKEDYRRLIYLHGLWMKVSCVLP